MNFLAMSEGRADQSKFRIMPLALWLAVAIVGGCVLGVAAGMARGGVEPSAAIMAAVTGGVSWGLASALGLVALHLLTSGRTEQLGMGVLASSTVRMLGGLAVALSVYFGIRPDSGAGGTVFWFGVLGCGLATLVVESAWAVSKLKALGVRGAPAHR